MNALFVLQSALLGVGLAMDAFSVSLANGLHEPQMPRSRLCLMAGIYGFFQFAMPMIGWFFVHSAAERFQAFQPFIPWIALALLAYIGGEMLVEGIRNLSAEEPSSSGPLSFGRLLLQGVATSIDALSVGFTIADYRAGLAFSASMIIAVVTFVICIIGLILGKTFGMRYARHASILGGVILIGIGLEIFISHFI